MTHIHISIRTPVCEHSILLYTIYPNNPITESIVHRLYETLDNGFLQPLQEKMIQLETTFHDLQTLFSKSATVDCATHWYACTRDVRAKTEQVMRNMTDVHLSFLIVDDDMLYDVHMNEEGSMDRLIMLLS